GARQSRDSFYRPPPVAPGRRRARPRRDAHGGTRHRSGRHGRRRARICRRRRRDARGRDFGLPGPAATRRDHGHRGNRHRRAGPRRVRAPPHAGARPAAAGRPAGQCQRDFPGGDGHSRSPASAGRLPVRRPHGRAPVVRRSGGPSLGRARRSDVSLGPPGRAGGGAPAQRGGAVTARSRPLGLDRSFGGLLSPSTARGAIARLGPALALVLVVAAFALLTEAPSRYLSATNLRIVLSQTVIVALGAIGMTMIIVSGGIDLSVGATIALSGVVAALGIGADWPVPAAAAAAVLAGGLVGLANGVLITGLRVVPFIATLGMLGIARGVAKWLAHEQTVNVPPTWLNDLVVTFPRAAWMVLCPGVWITLALALLMAFLRNGCQQMGWPNYIQEIIIGGIIVLAVALDRMRARGAAS